MDGHLEFWTNHSLDGTIRRQTNAIEEDGRHRPVIRHAAASGGSSAVDGELSELFFGPVPAQITRPVDALLRLKLGPCGAIQFSGNLGLNFRFNKP